MSKFSKNVYQNSKKLKLKKIVKIFGNFWVNVTLRLTNFEMTGIVIDSFMKLNNNIKTEGITDN